MQTSKVNDHLQIVASLAVLLGLVLVGLEMRQNNQLAEAESVRELVLSWNTISTSALESDISQLRLKSFSNPDELTDEEISQLNDWLWMIWNLMVAEASMDLRGLGYLESLGTFEEQLAKNFRFFYGDRFGRAWYLAHRDILLPRFVEVIDKEIEAMEGNPAAGYVERIKENL